MTTEAVFQHPVAISQVMVNFAARYGVDTATCLLGTGITENQLRDADALIARDQEMRLVENLILALPQVQAPGFELGLQYDVATFGIFGFVMRMSRNLREAFESALRYLPLSTAYCKFSMLSNEQDFGLIVDPSSIPQHLRQFLLERDMATAINLFHELGLHGVRVHRLEFQSKAPNHADRIRELCEIAPHYGCRNNAIILKREVADAKMPMYDAHLVRLLEEQCRIQLARRQVSGVTGQVRQLLLGPLGFVSSLEDVAEKMAMAPRSLRRRLDEEGNSFRDLVEAERKQIAIQLLEGTEMKLDEMALQLGYGDTASFTRAFRRWFGCPPSEYRKSLRNGSAS
ncbi:AraC family transcriptional regulator [Stenotrophobium rhamnosiphilum]|uniref:AraC family transcriptional regulator n=1 Tax=Stenotrophobium rhamnosiphilum TaxID=2029166 RepID=A0A2T5MJ02_9GAMM|nr:AraC family transcriptional regulator [Stenotrophobium rhamnosiphilum]PTU32550.1 AraC family transcriptional regulator [Stenotrophobium rhamnosiphilum]